MFEAHSPAELSQAARTCHSGSIPLVIRGEGTGYTAGAYNFASGLVLDTTQMNRVLDLDASKGTITAESGITIEDLREVALTAGWDLRHYPTSTTMRTSTTLGGFLQTSNYGLGSIRYGHITDFGNVVNMEVIPITEDAPRTLLDGADNRNEVIGCLRSLGTSAIVSEVTLALSPAQYWVDAGVTFQSFSQALEFAMKVQAAPGFDLRECAVFPSSMLTSSLNQGERKLNINFFRNKIPMQDHVEGERIEEANLNLWDKPDKQSFEFPEHVEETEAVVLMSINEAALPFLNYTAREHAGHTIYLEHNRGGFGWIDAVTWQQAAHRLSRYFSQEIFSHYELNLGALRPDNLGRVETDMEAVSDIIRDSILRNSQDLDKYRQAIGYTEEALTEVGGEARRGTTLKWIDETSLLSKDIRHRPAWFIEMIRRQDGSTGLIAQVNWRTQSENVHQIGARTSRIAGGLRGLQRSGVIESFIDPHQIDPERVFVDSPSFKHAEYAKAAKLRFDPKSLLNPRMSLPKLEL